VSTETPAGAARRVSASEALSRVADPAAAKRDEVYVVLSGTGTFFDGKERRAFAAGDFLFVAAGREHRFEDFSDDFATWVLFYGPEGGEAAD
jgi:quercetin dioxygenase-like cupin family protein